MPSRSVSIHAGDVKRCAWIDQMRTMVVVLVVNMDACITYSHVGNWYVKEPPDPPIVSKLMFIFWQAHLQSFFMGLLFLVSGYFAFASLSHRGPSGFLRERLLRLGVPTLLYMVVLNPLIVFVINPNGTVHGPLARAYFRYLYTGRFLGGSGPMWLAAALLMFSTALATRRFIRPAVNRNAGARRGAPHAGAICLWGLALVAVTFLVRTVEPLGASVLNMQLCYFPQYIVAFATGAASSRDGWLEALARSRSARLAGRLGLILGPPALAGVLIQGGVLQGKGMEAFAGGWNLQAVGFATWEQLTGLGLGLGALAFCSGRLTESTPLARWLADRSFGVYLFHPVVLVLAGIALRPMVADPFFKVSILTAAGLAGSYLLSDVGHRLPGLRAVM